MTDYSSRTLPWWYRDSSCYQDLHSHALECIDRDGRREELRAYRRLYRGHGAYGESELKIIQNSVLAVYAKLSRSQPATWVTTEGGAVELQERAKFLTSWIGGSRIDLGTDETARDALLDAAIYGTGAVHTFATKHGLHQELVWVGDLGVEEAEEENRSVRTLYRMMAMDKMAAQARWPSHKDDLENATYGPADDEIQQALADDGTNLITVVEAWHLGEYGQPGQHAIVASSCCLRWRKWERAKWPIDLMVWNKDPMRAFGFGLAESQRKGQQTLDYISEKIRVCFGKGSPKVLVPEESNVDDEAWTDMPYEQIRYSGGRPPEVTTPPAIASDARMYRDATIELLHQTNGVSQLAAMAAKPAGLDSGASIRAYNETEDAYWFPQAQRFEAFNSAIDRTMVASAEEFVGMKGTVKSKLETLGIDEQAGLSALRKVGYKAKTFDSQTMRIRAQPVAPLSNSPSGRLQDVSEMMGLELIEDKAEARRLLRMPDTRRWTDLRDAGRRLVELQVAAAIKGAPPDVDPQTIDLEFAAQHAQQQLQLAILEESRADLDGLRNYIASVDSELERQKQRLLEQQQAAQQAAAPPAGQPPMGAQSAPGLTAEPAPV